MSSQTSQTWSADAEPVERQIGQPPTFSMPGSEELIGDGSWQRAQDERDQGGPINDAERYVWLEGSEISYRVVFVLDGQTLRAACPCEAWHYRQWCAHVASCWWRWVRGEIDVVHMQTGREYEVPPSWLRFGETHEPLPESLTPAELDAYLHCELGSVGPTEWAEFTGRTKGTVGNLLARAREKVIEEVVR